MVSEQREQGLRNWQKASVAAAVSLLFGLGIFQSTWSTQMAGWITSSAETEFEVTVPLIDVENHAKETPIITSCIWNERRLKLNYSNAALHG